MKVVKVQFHTADREYFFLPEFSADKNTDIKIGDQVIVDTILGQDLGVITTWADWQAPEAKAEPAEASGQNNGEMITDVKPMLRHVTNDDLEQVKKQKKQYPKYLKKCDELCDRHGLAAMKLVDTAESFDGNRLTFYFISDSRVDFRELVKDLAKTYHKKIRLQQIGVRDAAKMEGDFGPCGLPLCCRHWLKVIGNVSPDFIKDQELSHRGVDRLSGPCSRLKCCLRFEEEAYKYNLEKLPKVGDVIKTKAGKGTVVAIHPMKQVVDLDIDGARVAYPYAEQAKCDGNCADANCHPANSQGDDYGLN